MSTRTGRLLAAGLGAILVLAFLRSQQSHPLAAAEPTGRPPQEVRVLAVDDEVLVASREVVGSVRPRRAAEVAARTMAEVLEVAVAAGDEVQAGDLLVRLDSAAAKAHVAEAEAGLVAREQALEEAQRELARTRTLFAGEARTQRELDAAGTAYEQARALRDAAAEAAVAARVARDDATLAAPFDGVVMERLVDPGDLALPGGPLLRIYDPTALWLELSIAASLLGDVARGDELEAELDALEPGARKFAARVDEIVPAVDPATRTALVRLALPALPGVRPGMFGRARIPFGERRALVVPATALVVRGQLELVFTVGGEDSRARMHVVRSGRRLADGRVEILAGLAGPQRVVVEGGADLLDGARVRLEDSR